MKEAYIVGSGLAGLAAAAFMIRDAQLSGEKIHVYEELPLSGGALDGVNKPDVGFVSRGGREMEDHFECLWDLYRSIPSLEVPNASYLDEFYWLDKEDPNSSNCRLIHNRGNEIPTDGTYTLGKSSEELIKLVMIPEEKLGDQNIEDFFSDDFFESNFWTYWATMFAFEKWHSLAEMRRYIMRFVHHIDGLPDFTALKFNKYNQYESLVMPLLNYLLENNVDIQYETKVENVITEEQDGQILATEIQLNQGGECKNISLTTDDYVFVTNGSLTESSTYGDHHTPAPATNIPGGSWTLWERMSSQNTKFGHPEKFFTNIPERAWRTTATLTIKNKEVAPYIERLTKRDLYDHKVNTGGIITVTDSNWLISFAVHRQPHFKSQAEGEIILWMYGLYSDTEGNYTHKKITDCTGEELTQELLFHLGVPEAIISEMAQQDSINAVPCYIPFVTSYFMPRVIGARPDVLPKGSQNLAFIGNFAESPSRDTVFTTEYSVRTAMEAVYMLFSIDRGIPEVFASVYDIREMLKALYYMSDKKAIKDMDFPIPELIKRIGLQKLEGTWLNDLLKEQHLI